MASTIAIDEKIKNCDWLYTIDMKYQIFKSEPIKIRVLLSNGDVCEVSELIKGKPNGIGTLRIALGD